MFHLTIELESSLRAAYLSLSPLLHSRTLISLQSQSLYPQPHWFVTLMTPPRMTTEQQSAVIGLLVGRKWLKKGGYTEFVWYFQGVMVLKSAYLLLRETKRMLETSRFCHLQAKKHHRLTWKRYIRWAHPDW